MKPARRDAFLPAFDRFFDDFFTKDNFVRSWPHKHGIDGSFAAKLIREKE